MKIDCTISETRDSFTHAASLVGWQQAYDQLESRIFLGRLIDIRTCSVRLFRETTNCKIRQVMSLPKEHRHLVLSLDWPGDSAADPVLQLLPGGRQYQIVVPGGFDVLCLSVPDRCGAELPVCSRRLVSRFYSQAPYEQFRTHWRDATTCLLQNRSRPDIADLADRLESDSRRLLEAINREAAWQTVDGGSREYVVGRCQRIVESRPSRPPSVDELCRVVGVSRRTLQYSFTSQTGMTPIQYLRTIRLNAVRRAIINAPYVPVLDHAAARGFLHSSYFSRVYAALFNERASETRARLQSKRIVH